MVTVVRPLLRTARMHMLTDYHCHILPQMDDGAKSIEMSCKMIRMMRDQGVKRIVATPHFYAHREESINSYLEKRQNAYERIVQSDASNVDILLGAEIAVEHGISGLPNIEKLRIADSRYILLELPYASFSHWILEEINNITYEYRLTPVLAHVHRYLDFYSKLELEEVLKLNAVLQFNNKAFDNFRERRFVKALIHEGYPYVFGSDAHNLTDRKPDWDLLKTKAKSNVIDRMEMLL